MSEEGRGGGEGKSGEVGEGRKWTEADGSGAQALTQTRVDLLDIKDKTKRSYPARLKTLSPEPGRSLQGQLPHSVCEGAADMACRQQGSREVEVKWTRDGDSQSERLSGRARGTDSQWGS